MKPRRPYTTFAVALAALSVFMALPSLCYAQPVPLPPDPTVLQQLLGALSGGHYLGLVLLLTVYARKLASPASGFPVTVSPQWLPTVSALGGLVYGFEASLQGGQSYAAAALQALIAAASSGFFDGLVTAIFNHGAAPKWAQTLVWLVDDVAGTGGGGAAGGGAVASGGLRAVPPAPPAATATKRVGFAAATVMAIAVLCAACGTPLAQQIEKLVLTDVENGQALSFIESAVVALDPALAKDMPSVDALIHAAIVMLETTGVLPVEAQAHAARIKEGCKAKLEAAKASGWVMPEATEKRVAAVLAGRDQQLVAAVRMGARL